MDKAENPVGPDAQPGSGSVTKLISVIMPVYNEEENLEPLHGLLTGVLSSLPNAYEIIYVDDGSTDESIDGLRRIAESDANTKVCQFTRNFGQTAAITAGLDMARGDLIILMDADLQNDPTEIPMMLTRLEEGYDVVSGWRKDRKDPWLTRRLPSQLANALISKITGVHLHDYGCSLKVYRREVIRGFRLYGEMHRYLPAYASQMGARIVEVPVNHKPRVHGKSKYGLERTFKVILDLFVVMYLKSFVSRPIHLFGGVGFSLMGVAGLIVCYLIWARLAAGKYMIASPLLLMAVMLFILGVQTIFMGLMSELLNRTYHESQDKPTYVVRHVFGVGASSGVSRSSVQDEKRGSDLLE